MMRVTSPQYHWSHYPKPDLEIIPTIYPLILHLWIIGLIKPTFNFLRQRIINSKAMLLKKNLSEELRAQPIRLLEAEASVHPIKN